MQDSNASAKLALLHKADLAASDDALIQRILLNRYRRLIVEAYLSDDMNEFEKARIRLCDLIGVPRQRKRRKVRKQNSRHKDGKRKFSVEQVRQARSLYASGVELRKIRKLLRVSHSEGFLDMVRGKTYRDVD